MVIDTDVVIRFLTGDDQKKADRFEVFLKSGKKARITDVTFAEIYWTLQSFYKFPKERTLQALESLLAFPSIESNSSVLHGILAILRIKNISFIDAYLISYSTNQDDGKILSFDRDFDRIMEIERIEP